MHWLIRLLIMLLHSKQKGGHFGLPPTESSRLTALVVATGASVMAFVVTVEAGFFWLRSESVMGVVVAQDSRPSGFGAWRGESFNPSIAYISGGERREARVSNWSRRHDFPVGATVEVRSVPAIRYDVRISSIFGMWSFALLLWGTAVVATIAAILLRRLRIAELSSKNDW